MSEDNRSIDSTTKSYAWGGITTTSHLGSFTTTTVDPGSEYVIGDTTLVYYNYTYYNQNAIKESYITYDKMLAEEGHLVSEDKEVLNKMLESKDQDTVKLAVELIKNKTKWLGCYLEALWVIKNPGLQQQILSLYN